MMNPSEIAEMASEYWKLLQAFDRSISNAPEPSRIRLAAQARYARERLNFILEKAGIRALAFDGKPFEVNLPVIAVNAEEAPIDSPAIIEQTLEPAIVTNDAVLRMGKVYLATPYKD